MGQLRYPEVTVRVLHTATMRFADYRQDFYALHPSRTDFDVYSPPCTDGQVALDPFTAEFANAPESHDGSGALTFRTGSGSSRPMQGSRSPARVTTPAAQGRAGIWRQGRRSGSRGRVRATTATRSRCDSR